MKTRFNTFDILCSITELQKLVGMRVHQIYDIDHKTYLIRLQKSEEKCTLLLESGNRFHTTAFEWPKNVAPSGFSMKLRKHLKNKRLEVLKQLGVDRIVDLQFGTGEVAFHVILELYDRGNIVLTDCDLNILNILRPHTEGEEIRFAVREKYPTERAREQSIPTVEHLTTIFSKAKTGEPLKKILNPHLVYGATVIEHALLQTGFPQNCRFGQHFQVEDIPRLIDTLNYAEKMLEEAKAALPKGYIVQKKEVRQKASGESEDFYTNQEFHPLIFEQYKLQPIKEFDTFNAAVDEFFSTLEGQKIDLKAIQQEREALKKLDNVRKDHAERLVTLEKTQEVDRHKGELITRNQELVDQAILIIRSAVASQLPWPDISHLVKEATARGDPVVSAIKHLKLDINHITLLLSDPYDDHNDSDDTDDSNRSSEEESNPLKPTLIDIDLDLSAFANAKRYYDQKKSAARKQQKTIESQGKALKSAEKKTKQTLKEMQAIMSISKARKIFWFEKFYWFITSENYLVIGGRDQHQNELIVKRYLRSTDVYVHADIHGASSVVILNPSGQPIPPKTLNEAGVMAVCYSAAWEAKVVTSAWWVNANQVSKTAPTGEYLTTGAFMVRGKKNYLPPCHLIMGFGFLFKLEESSVPRHKDERRVRPPEMEEDDDLREESTNPVEADQEIAVSDGEEPQDNKEAKLESVDEEIEDELGTQDDDEEEEETEPGQVHFPDTEIRVEHTTGSEAFIGSTVDGGGGVLSPSEPNVTLVVDKMEGKSYKKQNRKKEVKIKGTNENSNNNSNKQQQQNQIKRGHHGKLKKIKEKYKDQDEEERRLIMNILQSAGAGKEDKDKKKKNKNKGSKKQQAAGENATARKVLPKKEVVAPPPTEQGNVADVADDTEPAVAPIIDMLDSLTGCPIAEDELLFAVPVIAPYNTLQNYKYKIKMTPGTNKRGKAARTVVSVFLREKSATQHEKDLLKSVKEAELFQNLPGRVKLLAPNLQNKRK